MVNTLVTQGAPLENRESSVVGIQPHEGEFINFSTNDNTSNDVKALAEENGRLRALLEKARDREYTMSEPDNPTQFYKDLCAELGNDPNTKR